MFDLSRASIPADAESLLIKFRHGLGDASQMLLVLANLRHYYPRLRLAMASQRGKHSLHHGACDLALCLEDDPINDKEWQHVRDIPYFECYQAYDLVPSTKNFQCILDEFRLDPIAFPYRVAIDPYNAETARRYVQSLPSPAVAIHYQANTNAGNKNLRHETIKLLCEMLLANGFTPIILDWDRRSPLPDNKRIYNPGQNHPLWKQYGTGDGNALAALLQECRLCVGVDSGPLHVCQGTDTPGLGVFTRQHPIYCFDLNGELTHLVPEGHYEFIRGDKDVAYRYFCDHYQFETYTNIDKRLCDVVAHLLGIRERVDPTRDPGYRGSGRPYYDEAMRGGLDYAVYGGWQRDYGQWLADTLGLKGKHVLDVGCACGSIAQGFQVAGVHAHGVDINGYMVGRGRELFQLASMNICDAAHLWPYDPHCVDAAHLCEVVHELPERLTLPVLAELSRVVKPGGLVWCSCTDKDPAAAWGQAAAALGWTDARPEFEEALRGHPLSYLPRFPWKWVLYRTECKGS